jgi:glyoxylase-like metal-dependent hydrolase (beta-lactamase superfamily II)
MGQSFIVLRSHRTKRLFLLALSSVLSIALLIRSFHVSAFANASQSQRTDADNQVVIHQYESPKMDAVNLYWIEVTQGIILVDAGRFLSQARYALEEIRSKSNKPIIGILITHPHTDHYGGLPIFARAAISNVPIYGSEITSNDIRTDGQGFIQIRKELHGNDFPDRADIPLPNRIVKDGDTFQLGGLMFRVIDLPKNETLGTTLYHLPNQRVLFAGDVITNKSIPFLINGFSGNWLNQLNMLSQRYSDQMVYHGHGQPGVAKPLIAELSGYISTLRQQVGNALKSDNAITPEEKSAIVTAMKKQYPNYETSMVVQNLLERNIDGISQELKQTM